MAHCDVVEGCLRLVGRLLQEVGWFDQEKNSSGALTSRLASDSVAVKGQFGDTMGMLTQVRLFFP